MKRGGRLLPRHESLPTADGNSHMWFTETPWPPLLISAVLAILAFAVFHARGQAKYLVAAGALVLLGVGILLLERQIVTPAEEVEQAIADLCGAFQRDSVALREQGLVKGLLAKQELETLDYISAQAPDVRNLAVLGLRLVAVEEGYHLSDVQVEMKAENTRAVADFRVNGELSFGSYGSVGWKPSRWLLTWQHEDGRWKVIKVQRLDPISGQEIVNPLSP